MNRGTKRVRLRISADLLKHRLEIPPMVDVIGAVWKPEFAAVDLIVMGETIPDRLGCPEGATATVITIRTVSELAEALAE